MGSTCNGEMGGIEGPCSHLHIVVSFTINTHHKSGDEIRDDRLEPILEKRKLFQDLGMVRQVELDNRIVEEGESDAVDRVRATRIFGRGVMEGASSMKAEQS